MITFTVVGVAQPKGSARAFVPKPWAEAAHRRGVAPRAVVTHDNPRSKGWQALVADQAQRVAGGAIVDGPVTLTITFYLPRPVSLPRRVQHHVTRPDVDKLARSVSDALTGVLYHDDAQVVDLLVRKLYTPAGRAPHARITLEAAAPPVAKPAPLFED